MWRWQLESNLERSAASETLADLGQKKGGSMDCGEVQLEGAVGESSARVSCCGAQLLKS